MLNGNGKYGQVPQVGPGAFGKHVGQARRRPDTRRDDDDRSLARLDVDLPAIGPKVLLSHGTGGRAIIAMATHTARRSDHDRTLPITTLGFLEGWIIVAIDDYQGHTAEPWQESNCPTNVLPEKRLRFAPR